MAQKAIPGRLRPVYGTDENIECPRDAKTVENRRNEPNVVLEAVIESNGHSSLRQIFFTFEKEQDIVHAYGAKSSRNQLHLPLEHGGGVNAVASDGVGVLFRSILDGVIAQNDRSGGGQLVRHTKRSTRHKYFLGDGSGCFLNTHWAPSCEDWDSTGFT